MSKQAKHTHGPWEVESHYSPDGSDLVILHDQCTVIADCRNQCGVRDCDEAEANARLIAAAPDLLEALERIRRTSVAETFGGDVGRFQSWLDSFTDAAIARAKGVTP